MRLFYEDYKSGYVDVIDNVDRVKIESTKTKIHYVCIQTEKITQRT